MKCVRHFVEKQFHAAAWEWRFLINTGQMARYISAQSDGLIMLNNTLPNRKEIA